MHNIPANTIHENNTLLFTRPAAQALLEQQVFQECNLYDLEDFELVFWQEGNDSFELYYKKLCEQFFPKITPLEGVSYKRHFKETLSNILQILEKKQKVTLSKNLFYEAARNILVPTSTEKHSTPTDDEETQWLHAIYYSYHTIKPETKTYILEKIAFLFSCRQDFTALEQLAQEYPAIMSLDPITFYAKHGHLEKVRLLLNDASIENKGQALRDATVWSQAAVVQELLCTTREDILLKDKEWAFVQAAERGYPAIVQAFLDTKQIFSEKCNDKALLGAAIKGHLFVVQALLVTIRENISIEARDWAIRWAVSFNHFEVAQALIATIHEDQNLVFLEAAEYGNIPVVQALLHTSKKILSQDCKNKALVCAAAKGHRTIVKTLIETIEDISIEAKGLAIARAIFFKQLGVTETLLKTLGQDQSQVFLQAAELGRLPVVQEFLNTVELSLSDKGKALIFSATKGKLGVVQTLVANVGEEISKEDKEWALIHAATRGHLPVTQLLLNNFGKDISQKAKKWARSCASVKGHYAVARTLLNTTQKIFRKAKNETHACATTEKLIKGSRALPSRRSPRHKYKI